MLTLRGGAPQLLQWALQALTAGIGCSLLLLLPVASGWLLVWTQSGSTPGMGAVAGSVLGAVTLGGSLGLLGVGRRLRR